MNRFESVEAALREARRVVDPATGSLCDTAAERDLDTLAYLELPIAPALGRAIHTVISEAIDARSTFLDACGKVRTVLAQHGITLAHEDDAPGAAH